MDIKQFAEKNRLKVKKDSCDDLIIIGKFVKETGTDRPEYHHHIYEVNGNFFAYFNFATVRKWNTVRKKMTAAGARIITSGATDGYFAFDVADEALVKLVTKLVGVRVRRQLTDEQKQKIRARFAKA